MKKILITLAILISGSAYAQNYIEIIERIAQRSLEMKAHRAEFTADSLEYRRDLNPEDPEIEMEYFFDNNKEIVIAQSFDFPTVYSQRNKLSKLSIERAHIDFRNSQRELMFQISEQYIELTYHNKVVKLLTERSDRLKEYVDKVRRGVELGENISLDLEAAENLAKQMQTELILAQSAKKQCENTLIQWSSIEPKQFTAYPDFHQITFTEFINAAMSKDLSLDAAKTESLIADRMLKLSRNEWLPKLKVGYKMAFEGSDLRNGVVAGISVPLWQNRGNVKHSKAVIESAQAKQKATIISVKTSLENLYTAYESTENSLKIYPNDNRHFIDLLKKSLDSGAITSSEFLLSIIDRYSVQQRYLELEMENVQNRAMMEILMN